MLLTFTVYVITFSVPNTNYPILVYPVGGAGELHPYGDHCWGRRGESILDGDGTGGG